MPRKSELAEIEKGRRLAQASLDLSYAVEDIAKKNKLSGWETVQLVQELSHKAVMIAVKTEGELK